MKTPAAAAAAGVGNDIPQHLPVAQPCAANQTSQTKRTNHSKIPLRIYSMPFDVFVDHLRTIYGDTAVDAMLAGIKRIDASGTPPAVPWPEPQRTPPAAATAQDNRTDFSSDLDDKDLEDNDNNSDGDADPYL